MKIKTCFIQLCNIVMLYFIILFFDFNMDCFAIETLTNRNAVQDTTSIQKEKYINKYIILPDNSRIQITSILKNKDFVTKEGIIISPAGIIKNGKFAGIKIKIDDPGIDKNSRYGQQVGSGSLNIDRHEEVVHIDSHSIPLTKENSSINNARDNADDLENMEHSASLDDLFAFAGNIPEKDANKDKNNNKNENPKTNGSNSQKDKPRKSAPSKDLYIPEESVKTGSIDFLSGCWKGSSIEYDTKRKIGTCFCFQKGGKSGQETIIDPGFTGICRGAASARMGPKGTLIIDSAPRKNSAGQDVWIAQRMICRNKGKKAFCTEAFHDGRRQSFETAFERTDSCP